MSSTAANGICASCRGPLTPWPPRHEGRRGIAPATPPGTNDTGDKVSCLSPPCDHYGLVVRVRPQDLSEAG